MEKIEFTTDLTESPVIIVPAEVLARMPKSGRIRVTVVSADVVDGHDDDDDADWRSFTYEQFLRGESPEDAIYDSLK